MAETGSTSSDATLPADSGSSAAANPDWEMLSLSMSASALGKSALGTDPDKPNPQIESSFSQHAAVNRDGSGDVVAEPFTEGWKPHLSTSSDLYGYGAEHGYTEQNQPQEAVLSRQDSEKYFDSIVSTSPKPRYKMGKRPRRPRVMWSIAVAATMVGIAVLGHRWRLACRDNEQLRLELSAKDEKLNDLLYQVSRLKEMVGGYHRAPVTRNSGF